MRVRVAGSSRAIGPVLGAAISSSGRSSESRSWTTSGTGSRPPLLLLISLFLVARDRARGQPAGAARAGVAAARRRAILFGVIFAVGVFVGAIGTLVGTQLADLLQNSETYIRDTVDRSTTRSDTSLDPQEVVDDFNDPNRAGAGVHRRPAGQRRRPVAPSAERLLPGAVGPAVHLLPRRGRPAACVARSVRDSDPIDNVRCSPSGSWRSPRPAATSTRGRCSRCCRRSSTGSCSSRRGSRRRSRSRCGSASSASSSRWSARTSPGCCRCCITFLDSPVQGGDRARLHHRVPAGRELLLRTAHHRPDDGAAPGHRVRCRTGRLLVARCRRGRSSRSRRRR